MHYIYMESKFSGASLSLHVANWYHRSLDLSTLIGPTYLVEASRVLRLFVTVYMVGREFRLSYVS